MAGQLQTRKLSVVFIAPYVFSPTLELALNDTKNSKTLPTHNQISSTNNSPKMTDKDSSTLQSYIDKVSFSYLTPLTVSE